jgi:hypothetical protein
MTADVDRGVIWARELTRVRQPETWLDEYALVEVLADRLADRLARAIDTGDRVVLERLARGCRAFAAWSWRDEAVVSWLWVSTGEEYAPPIRCTLRIPEWDCYGWGAGTVEGHRCRGLFTGLLEHAGWRLAREGRRTMWGGILDGNLPSQRANAAAGMRPVLHVIALHEPVPTRLVCRPVEYADPLLVKQARRLLGLPQATEGTADGAPVPVVGRCPAPLAAATGGTR